MKRTARILNFYGKELGNVNDLHLALNALLVDTLAGDITPVESLEIQKELNASLKGVKAGLRTLTALLKFEKLVRGHR